MAANGSIFFFAGSSLKNRAPPISSPDPIIRTAVIGSIHQKVISAGSKCCTILVKIRNGSNILTVIWESIFMLFWGSSLVLTKMPAPKAMANILINAQRTGMNAL